MKSKNSLKIIVTLYAVTVVFWFALLISVKYSIFSAATLDLLRSFTQIPLMIIPFVGGILGLKNYTIWGGVKNTSGRSSLFLSLGLIFWSSGMIIWNYYFFFTAVKVPYPSLADFGYIFGLLFFIVGISSLSKIVGVKFALRNKEGKFIFFLIPTIVVFVSIYLLIDVARGGVFVDSSGGYFKLFFDILYILVDVVILTIISLLYFFSKKFLGGRYKIPVLILLFGFLSIYISDFIFVFTTSSGTYFNGHFVDFLYTTTMFILSLGVVTLDPERVSSLLDDNLIKVDNDKSFTLTNSTKILKQIIIIIIKKQEKFAGQIAWEEAKDIPGLVIVDQIRGEISVSDDSNENLRKIIDQLIYVYKNLFGDLAVKVSKNAVYHLIMKLPPEEVPESLR